MANKVTFALDIDAAGQVILQDMVKPIISKSGDAIKARAQSMAQSLSSNPNIDFKSRTTVGTIRKGTRVFTTISADYSDKRSEYIARQALAKAKDAGRLN